MRIVPTEREHIRGLEALEGDRYGPNAEAMFDQDRAEDYLRDCAWTILDGEAIAAVVGLAFIRPGVAEVWGVFTATAKNDPAKLIDCCRQAKEEAFERLGLWRMQAVADAGFLAANELIRACGFAFETELDSYIAPGKLCNLYADIRPFEEEGHG